MAVPLSLFIRSIFNIPPVGITYFYFRLVLYCTYCMFPSPSNFYFPRWHCKLQHSFSPLYDYIGKSCSTCFLFCCVFWLSRVKRRWCMIYSELSKGQVCFPECCCSDVMVAGVKTVGFLRPWWHTARLYILHWRKRMPELMIIFYWVYFLCHIFCQIFCSFVSWGFQFTKIYCINFHFLKLCSLCSKPFMFYVFFL